MKGIIREWKKLRISRGDKTPKVYFSKGTAKYVRFNATFLKVFGLEDKNSVDIYLNEDGENTLIGFVFNDDNKGTLKLSKNGDTGTGYVSASSLFREAGINNNEMKRNGFVPEKQVINGKEGFIISVEKQK